MKTIVLNTFLLLILVSCGSSTEKQATTTDAELPKALIDKLPETEKEEPLRVVALKDGELLINRVFATSTELPQSQNSVYNCFDSDHQTSWKTIAGSGPEEGVMIYLAYPTYIDKILIFDENGNEATNVEVYIDGRTNYGAGKIDTKVSNLFIKAHPTFKTKLHRPDNVSTRTFHPKAFFAISEIQFFIGENTQYKIITPIQLTGTVAASSNLTPVVAYGASNLVDGQLENAWAEAKDDFGIGETITFKLDHKIVVDKLQIWNGYQRSLEHFKQNAALQNFDLSVDGSAPLSYTLQKAYSGQTVELEEAIAGTEFTFTIKSGYRGTNYKDLVISELQFLSKGISYDISTTTETDRVKANRMLKSELLNKVLDRNLNITKSQTSKEGTVERNTYVSRSLLLRSNNTFVLYEREEESFYDAAMEEEEYYDDYSENIEEVIADGSWELKSITNDKVELRIFGKKFEPRSSSDIYKGDVQNESLKIFQDFITITPQELKGKFVVGSIPL